MKKKILSFFGAIKEKIDNISPFFLALILFEIFLFFPLSTYNHTTASGDIAEYLNNPLRVINGELPYRDFWLLFPPGEVFLPALIYRIFGVNINNVLISSVVISAFIGVFSFILGKVIFRDNFFATIAAMLVFFKGVPYFSLGYIYNHMYLMLLLISTFLFIKYLRDSENNKVGLCLTGIFVGSAFLFRIYEVGAAFLTFILTIFIYSKFYGKTFSQSIKSIMIFCGGVLFIIISVLLLLIKIWYPMIKEVMIESVLHGASMKLPYFSIPVSYLRQIFTYFLKTKSIVNIGTLFCHLIKFIRVTLYYLLPFLLGGISFWYLVNMKLEKNDKIIVLFFLLWGFFTLPKALTRAHMDNLACSTTPLFFLLVFLLQKNTRNFIKLNNRLEKVTIWITIIITLSLLVSPSLFFGSIGHKLPYYEVSTKHGTLLFSDKTEAENVDAVIDFINKNTKEGDYIFVTPWYAPPFYALTNRKNPTYYDSLIDVVIRPSEKKQIKICHDLFNKNTKLIIHYPDWGFNSKRELNFLNACPILQKFIEDNFELVRKYGHYWIYLPKRGNP